MEKKPMQQEKKIIEMIRKNGFCKTNIDNMLNIDKLKREFDETIKKGDINPPRRPEAGKKQLKRQELTVYHQKVISGDNLRIPEDVVKQGEKYYKEECVHVTTSDPLVKYEGLLNLCVNKEIIGIADNYLNGKSGIGYVKIKKSYANKLEYRSYNHKFHIDDNAPEILKIIFYLNEVGKGGGGFNYVEGSHKNNKLAVYENVTFDDHEVTEIYSKKVQHEFCGKKGTCIICDTKGLHKEGMATAKDRYSVIINYTLEEEYKGSRGKQKVRGKWLRKLDESQKRVLRFMEVVG